MSMPSPFEMGKAVGGNVSGGIRSGLENRAIGQILQQAQQIQDPNELNNIMSQVLPSLSPQGQQVLGQAVQRQQQQLQQKRSSQSFSKLTGLDPQVVSGMTPKEREIYLTKGTFGTQQKGAGDTALLQKAFTNVKDIVKRGYTGMTAKSLSATGRRDRAKLDTNSEIFISHLIPLINPKGTMSKSRFNYIKSLVPRGHDTDATIEGKLSGLETIFSMNPQQLASFETMPDNDFKALFANKQASRIANNNLANQQQATNEQLDAVLQRTGGDIDAAMKILSGK